MIKEIDHFEKIRKNQKNQKIARIPCHGTEFGPNLLRRISDDYIKQIN